MIVFDLNCGKGHRFEAWFRSSTDYEEQREAGSLACPVCGDSGCEKALMAPNIAVSRAGDVDPRKVAAAMWSKLAELRQQVETNCDYVGERSAEEARRIRYGEVEKRDIYGEASADEAKELKEEGVEFGVIPWVPRADN